MNTPAASPAVTTPPASRWVRMALINTLEELAALPAGITGFAADGAPVHVHPEYGAVIIGSEPQFSVQPTLPMTAFLGTGDVADQDMVDEITDVALAEGYRLQAQACPLESSPWVSRLVRDVVDAAVAAALRVTAPGLVP